MEDAPADPPEKSQAPWGFWSTMGLSFVVALSYVAISILILFAIGTAYLAADPNMNMDEFLNSAETNGFVAFLGISLAAPLCTGLVLLFIKWKATLSVKEYLCLVPVGGKTALIWSASLLLLLIGSDLVTHALGRPIVPEIMAELYRTSHFVGLSWFAVVIAGPIFEEAFFRGFMFRGIQASALGNIGAILITALTWAAIHTQYDVYWLAQVFVLGLFLGAARAATGSLYLTTAMHAAMNLIAIVEIHLFTGS